MGLAAREKLAGVYLPEVAGEWLGGIYGEAAQPPGE